MVNKQKKTIVSFNGDQKDMWRELRRRGITSKPFPVFVKDAFYDKIDEINFKLRGEMNDKVPLQQQVG